MKYSKIEGLALSEKIFRLNFPVCLLFTETEAWIEGGKGALAQGLTKMLLDIC